MIDPEAFLEDHVRTLREGEILEDDLTRGACPGQVAIPWLPGILGCMVRISPHNILGEEQHLSWIETMRRTGPTEAVGCTIEVGAMSFRLTSPAFLEGGLIPRLHTCEGADLSPALEWNGEPEETKSFVLIVDDPDASVGTWNHWLLWDLPVSTHTLAQGLKAGHTGESGTNDFGGLGYGGPCPPKGHGPHRYFFKLYAVDVPSLGLSRGSRRAELERALKGHSRGEAQYIGRYERM
jgi:Raf kinase inhibitor-like YbhB/YbcL family protein